MRHTGLSLSILTLVILSGTWVAAAGPPQLLDLVPDRSSNGSKSADHLAVAQKSILKLSDETIAASRSQDDGASTPVADERSKTELSRIEAGINRKMKSLERAIEREEKKLEAKFTELNKRREKALAKSDEKQLKRIEVLEKKAVQDYERRVESFLQSAVASAKPQPIQKSVGNRRNASAADTKSMTAAQRKQSRPAEPPKQRRRFRLWPFR